MQAYQPDSTSRVYLERFYIPLTFISVARSNKKQIDWAQLDKEVGEVVDKEEEENLSGDARLNRLFKDIYDRADEVCMPSKTEPVLFE